MINNNSIILGLDISTQNTGWSIVKYVDKDNYQLKCYGDIPRGKGKHQLDIEDALINFEKKLIEIIETFKPNYISAEAPFASRNINTLQKLCWFHGVMQLVAKKYNIPVTYYAVMTMKSKTVGHMNIKNEDGTKKTGKEMKMEVQQAVIDIFGEENIIMELNDDMSDSISAIYTFIVMNGLPIEKKKKGAK